MAGMIGWADIERMMIETEAPEETQDEWMADNDISEEAFLGICKKLLSTARKEMATLAASGEYDFIRILDLVILTTAGTAFHIGWETQKMYGKRGAVIEHEQ